MSSPAVPRRALGWSAARAAGCLWLRAHSAGPRPSQSAAERSAPRSAKVRRTSAKPPAAAKCIGVTACRSVARTSCSTTSCGDKKGAPVSGGAGRR